MKKSYKRHLSEKDKETLRVTIETCRLLEEKHEY